MAGSYEHGNGPLGYMKVHIFLDWLSVPSVPQQGICTIQLHIRKCHVKSLLLISYVSNGFVFAVYMHQDCLNCIMKLQSAHLKMYFFPICIFSI